MDIFLYVADDIQSLAGNKTLMVGVYTDRVIVVTVPNDAPVKPTPETPVGISALSVMLTITGLTPGPRTVQPTLTFPDGRPSLNVIEPMTFTVEPGGGANLLIKFNPFVVSQAGKYTFALTIDGEPIAASFEVRLS